MPDEFLAVFPGLNAAIQGPPKEEAGSSKYAPIKRKRAKENPEDSSESEEVEDDVLLEETFGEVERKRPEMYGPMRLDDFQAVRRGDGDAWQGQVKRRGPQQEWCKANHLQQTFKCKISLGEEAAKTITEAWAHRMQFLYTSDQDGLFTTPALTGHAMALYQEPAKFTELMERAKGELLELGSRIRALRVR